MQVGFPPVDLPGPSGSTNPVARSRARLASRRWRLFLTIKARQNAQTTILPPANFHECGLSQRPARLRALSTSCGCTDGLFSSLRRAAGRAFGADGGVRCRRLRRGSADGGRSASHRCAHDLAKTERMALRRPLCFLRRPASAAPMAGSAGRFCDQGNAPAARAGDRPLPLHEQQQAHRHHRHAADEAVDGKVVFAVLPRRGQQFVEGDEHHDAGHRGEEDAEHRV